MTSKTKIDILIPAIEKDLATLPYVIASARENINHPIGRILIVAPKRKRIMELCRRLEVTFVDEDTLLPITKKHINYRSKRWDRSGWIFQQLLKWCGDSLCTAKFYLVMDADTVLIRPHTFLEGNKKVFYSRRWSHQQYFKAYHKLLGKKVTSPSSFVTHYMLLEKAKVSELKKAIEAKHHTSWYQAILQNIDKTKLYAYSEFETYGNFLYAQDPSRIVFRKALNKDLHQSITKLSIEQRKQLARKYRSLSFHKRRGYFLKPQQSKASKHAKAPKHAIAPKNLVLKDQNKRKETLP
ncbi:MAG: DUF6492 family protein [Gorillibacterium sp.]|nr:DUF6492 family protein [Gorillibacterium sp.]